MRLDRIIPMAGAALLAFGGLAACDKVPAPDTETATGTHPGGPGGAPPCAPPDFPGEYGAGVDEPEKFPLQAQEEFAGGVRWAICGAGTGHAAQVLNLRSDDEGASWSVNYTGLQFLRTHAGDTLDVEFEADGRSASMHVVSQVGETDQTWWTGDGGELWRVDCN